MRTPVALVLVALCVGPARGAWFADHAVAYTPGVAPVTPFNPTGALFLNDPAATLGAPGAIVPGFPAFPPFGLTPAEPLNPFVPHFAADEVTQIGAGGELVLRLERFVEVGAGPELGVFGTVGLADAGNKTAAPDATAPGASFGVTRVRVDVSETGLPGSWASLAGGDRVVIDTPASYYTNASGLVGPTELAADLAPLLAGLTPADFGQPFTHPAGLAAFNGLSITQAETLLAGSAGGDWFDLDGLTAGGAPLTRVGYVRFYDPATTFQVMAVSINTSLAGGAVAPEPSALLLACVAGWGLAGTRRK